MTDAQLRMRIRAAGHWIGHFVTPERLSATGWLYGVLLPAAAPERYAAELRVNNTGLIVRVVPGVAARPVVQA
jgi:hypothetical protein